MRPAAVMIASRFTSFAQPAPSAGPALLGGGGAQRRNSVGRGGGSGGSGGADGGADAGSGAGGGGADAVAERLAQ